MSWGTRCNQAIQLGSIRYAAPHKTVLERPTNRPLRECVASSLLRLYRLYECGNRCNRRKSSPRRTSFRGIPGCDHEEFEPGACRLRAGPACMHTSHTQKSRSVYQERLDEFLPDCGADPQGCLDTNSRSIHSIR